MNQNKISAQQTKFKSYEFAGPSSRRGWVWSRRRVGGSSEENTRQTLSQRFTCGTTTMHRISFTLGLSGGDTPYKYPAICVLRSDTVMN